MKILFVLQNFPPSIFGGISNSMFPIIDELNKSSYDIKVLTTNYKIPDKSTITNRWVKHKGISVNYIRTKYSAFSFRLFLEGFRQIKQSDQVHLSSIFYFPNLLFAIYGTIKGKEIFLSPHGELHAPALNYKAWKKKPYLFLLRYTLKNIRFRATSDQEFDRIKIYFPTSSVYIIPNFFKSKEPINEEKRNQFIFLGRISPIKNIENLIRACGISKLFLSSNFKLLLAGPIDKEFLTYQKTLNELIGEHDLTEKVVFSGEIYSPEKERLLSQSKAMFLVSHSENFGNVVVESLSQGTPVVASKGTPWQTLETCNSGYWIDNLPEAISSKIDELISMDFNTYNRMTQNAILLSNEFTTDKIMPKWINLINQSIYV